MNEPVPTGRRWRTTRPRVTHLLLFSLVHLTLFASSSHTLHISKQRFANEDVNENILSESHQWSNWSPWSPCSRSCDGGISMSLRKCLTKTECVGGKVERYKICNMQPCPVSTDFRAKQCSIFNNKPYRDRFYEWLPFIDPAEPCSLTCQAKGLNFVAKLAASVKDGTRCRPGTLEMCVAGKCLSVGCDLQLGSLTKIDDCGVCGGDGTTCSKFLDYSWTHRYLADCSHSCGRGFQLSTVVCHNVLLNITVDDIYCQAYFKPRPEQRTCNDIPCPPTWVAEKFGDCDRQCGGGKRRRNVVCAALTTPNDDQKVIRPDEECQLQPRPDTEEKCNTQGCPQWYEGLWSECSETCGNGIQTRPVVCKDAQGLNSADCQLELKPMSWRNCSDISKCLHGTTSNSQEDSPHLVTFNKVTSEPNFIVGSWSACNVSCGIGSRVRSIECKIHLEFSKTEVSIPESQCPGEKPLEIEECFANDCEGTHLEVEYLGGEQRPKVELSYQVLNESSYAWQESGFTECSLPCLGGTQETRYVCKHTKNNVTVDSKFCNIHSKPDTFTRTCNDHPCPPRWNVTEFGECTKECSGGIQFRSVRCVHAVTRGSPNFVVIPEDRCQSPMPETRRPCNQRDCPAKWIAGPWSECHCGKKSRVKSRSIRCMKEFYLNGSREVPSIECKAFRKPKAMKTCHLKNCQYSLHKNYKNELSRKSKRNFNTAWPKEHVTFRVEGKATAYEGSIIKLRCPEWKKDLEGDLSWSKGNERLVKGKKCIMNGNVLKLKNVRLSDTNVYKCWSDPENVHSMFLHILPRSNATLPELNSVHLSDTANTERQRSYYKNELDLSEEAQKYTFRSKADLRMPPVEVTQPNTAESDDSREMSPTRLPSLKPLISENDPSLNEVETPLKDDQKGKRVPSLFDESNYNDLKYNWITTDWTNCTIACGGIGFKIRHSQCFVQLGNVTQAVESSFCTGRGLVKPKSIETCGSRECSFWKVGKWSECDDCLDHHQGLQSRSVNCMLPNGTVIEDLSCSQQSLKPPESQQCVNVNCTSHWLPKSWTECNRNGYRSRQVQCVWKITQKPAKSSSQCKALKKPSTVEHCKDSLMADY